VSSAALAFLPEGPKGFGSGGYLLWPLFGTANQLLAGISLLLVSVWLKRLGRNYAVTMIPMIFLMFVTLYALFKQVIYSWSWFVMATKLLLIIFGAMILGCALRITVTAILTMTQQSVNAVEDFKNVKRLLMARHQCRK